MVTAANLGFPRVGLHRELKSAVEGYWKGKASKEELLRVAADLRAARRLAFLGMRGLSNSLP